MIGVWILGLQCENPGVGRRVQLDDRLHGQRPVDEVGRLVVHILDSDNHPLVVSVYIYRRSILNFQKLKQLGSTSRYGKINLHCSPLHSEVTAQKIAWKRQSK